METRFDEIARLLGADMPRRQALRRIGAVLGGALLTALGLGSPAHAATPAQQLACIQRCRTFQRVQNLWRVCMLSCLNCPAGQTFCGPGVCANLFGSNSNCGACGNVCPRGTFCFQGVCESD